MRGASNVIRKLGGASNSDGTRHGDFLIGAKRCYAARASWKSSMVVNRRPARS